MIIEVIKLALEVCSTSIETFPIFGTVLRICVGHRLTWLISGALNAQSRDIRLKIEELTFKRLFYWRAKYCQFKKIITWQSPACAEEKPITAKIPMVFIATWCIVKEISQLLYTVLYCFLCFLCSLFSCAALYDLLCANLTQYIAPSAAHVIHPSGQLGYEEGFGWKLAIKHYC